MPDLPSPGLSSEITGCVHANHPASQGFLQAEIHVVNFAAAAFPAANLAIYVPFRVDDFMVAKQMFWENGGVAGTTDVGIYDATATRLVNLTATTNSGARQIGNITDTTLPPGNYYMGILASTVTTQTYWSAVIGVPALRALGFQQQAVGAATLPANATFAKVANAYMPHVGISFQATM